MKNERIFKSVAALSHPFSITALLFLLLNDHVVRRHWPSWWTGKLGDVAWLFVAPMLLLLPLALVLKPQRQAHFRLITGFTYAFTALIFLLANTSMVFNALLNGLGVRFLYIPLRITMDPTDLITLPMLLLSLIFWMRIKPLGVERRSKGVLLAAFGGLLTLANMAAPQFGIDALQVDGDHIIACTNFQAYTSQDGGLTWELSNLSYGSSCQDDWDGTLFFDFNSEKKEYRYFYEAQVIESSMDGGKTWITEYVIQPSSQAEQSMQEKNHASNAFYQQGPMDAVFDPHSGSLIFAMGLEGVLVRTVNGEWLQVGVGGFQAVQIDTFSGAITLLGGELLLALGLFLLLFSTAGIRLKPKFYTWIPLVLGWMGWLGVLTLFQPAMYDNYPIPIDLLFSLLAIAIVPLSCYFIYQLIRQYRMRIIKLRLLIFMIALLFVLPYLLWGLNIIPEYGYALLFGLLIAGLGVFLCLWVMRGIDGPYQE